MHTIIDHAGQERERMAHPGVTAAAMRGLAPLAVGASPQPVRV